MTRKKNQHSFRMREFEWKASESRSENKGEGEGTAEKVKIVGPSSWKKEWVCRKSSLRWGKEEAGGGRRFKENSTRGQSVGPIDKRRSKDDYGGRTIRRAAVRHQGGKKGRKGKAGKAHGQPYQCCGKKVKGGKGTTGAGWDTTLD